MQIAVNVDANEPHAAGSEHGGKVQHLCEGLARGLS
jgi:hypothetical protein